MDAHPVSHPTDQTLTSYGLGKLDDGSADAVHRQLERCPAGLKLLLAQRADFAVLDIHDLALARQQGRDVVGILPLVQRPLAAVLAQPDVANPRDLVGKSVGVTGVPSDVTRWAS